MESVQVENVAHVTLYDTSNWLQRAQGPTKKKKVHRTTADKALKHIFRSNTVRYHPTSPYLVAELPE